MLGTEGHIPLCTPLAKTNEHKAWNRKRKAKAFLLEKKIEGKRGGEGEKEKIKTGGCAVCAYFGLHSQAVDTATSVCASTSALPAPQHVCPMKGEQLSCLYFSPPPKKKSAMMSP